jgi:hypothetical protein
MHGIHVTNKKANNMEWEYWIMAITITICTFIFSSVETAKYISEHYHCTPIEL